MKTGRTKINADIKDQFKSSRSDQRGRPCHDPISLVFFLINKSFHIQRGCFYNPIFLSYILLSQCCYSLCEMNVIVAWQ